MAGKLGPRPVAIRIRCPKDFELAQELPIPAVGLGVVRHRKHPLRASVWSILVPMAFASPHQLHGERR
jgi:hypothetical protein